ncbi:MAG: hypothetical protein A3G29_09150 [Burkholderiales bacterium RIFCSPLOWO2_12_FULL_64_99]|nr:MAG: hypothetical protein A3G29_09150 [Burkholderiales bacterium RIFCSPLOWO2_12_FULL_64_99]
MAPLDWLQAKDSAENCAVEERRWSASVPPALGLMSRAEQQSREAMAPLDWLQAKDSAENSAVGERRWSASVSPALGLMSAHRLMFASTAAAARARNTNNTISVNRSARALHGHMLDDQSSSAQEQEAAGEALGSD